jgi:hypothetical protein
MSSTAAQKLIEGQDTSNTGTLVFAWAHAMRPLLDGTLVHRVLGP